MPHRRVLAAEAPQRKSRNTELSGYVMLSSYLPSIAANTWYQVTIPLAAWGATSTLTGIMAMRSTTGTVYFDDIKLIATSSSVGGTASTTITYVHTDHLGSINATTNASGTIAALRDYYPYGQERVSSGSQSRTYIGEVGDTDLGLQYLNARYQSPTRGNFISQDPMFWS